MFLYIKTWENNLIFVATLALKVLLDVDVVSVLTKYKDMLYWKIQLDSDVLNVTEFTKIIHSGFHLC